MSESVRTEATEWKEPKTIWNGMFLSLFIINLSLNMGQQMSNSLLSLYANSVGAPADQIGQLMSMFAVTALIFRFVSGPAMNAFDRKKLVSMAMGFMATAYIGFAFAVQIGEFFGIATITILKAFRLIQGIGNAFGNACCLAMVPDTLPKDKFSTGMGYYACAQVVAQAIAPTIAVFLRDCFGYNITYVIIFAVAVCAIILATIVRVAPQKKASFKLNFNNMVAKEAVIPAGITFFVNMGFTSISSFLLVYAEERGIVGGSWFFTVYAVTLLMTRPMVGKLTEKHGFVKIGIPSVFMTALSLAMIGYSSNIYMLLAAAFVNAFGFGAVQPMLQSLCMKSVSPERRGSAAGTNYIAMDSATLIGPTVCGIVAERMGYTPIMWLVMTVPILVSMAAIFFFRKSIRGIETDFQT